MEIVHDTVELETYMKEAVRVSQHHPVLIDSYLRNAIELDVDAVCDGEEVLIGGIMEHIEQAGIHSGDSACVIPPQSLSPEIIATVREYTRRIALGLGVVGLVNIQMAVKDNVVYILEANPTGKPHRSVCLKGNRSSHCKDCRKGHDRQETAGSRLPGTKDPPCSGQRGAPAL